LDRQSRIEQLAQAERHASEGARLLAKQETLIAELNRDGHDTARALKMLVTMRNTQALHQQDVERILRELAEPAVGLI
jgi:hypothetical protein